MDLEEKLRNGIKIFSIDNVLLRCKTELENNDDNNEERNEKLKELIKKFRELKNLYEDMNKDKKYDTGLIDQYLYKKSWKNLGIVQKHTKIKEYVNEFDISKKEKTRLIKEIYELANKGKIDAKTKVTYDHEKEKILEMSFLFNDDGKYSIDLERKQLKPKKKTTKNKAKKK